MIIDDCIGRVWKQDCLPAHWVHIQSAVADDCILDGITIAGPPITAPT